MNVAQPNAARFPQKTVYYRVTAWSAGVIFLSWLFSISGHLLVWGVAGWLLAGTAAPPSGFSDEATRTVGLRLRPTYSEHSVSSREKESGDSSPNETNPTDELQSTPPVSVPEFPVAPEQAPSTQTAKVPRTLLGPGANVPGPNSSSGGKRTADNTKPNTKPGKTRSSVGAVAGTAFMGVRDEATRVVFVIDCSASMIEHNAMRIAKAALVSSLETLGINQQFQIVFYNETATTLRLPGDTERTLYPATDVNRRLAGQQIDRVRPESGTLHLPALKLALKLNPEVIYFLTDAQEPMLTARERDEVRRENRKGTRIHCIEFGLHAELKNVDNFLKVLARENNGSYRYFNVLEFGGR